MADCCDSITDLGCVGHCDNIATGLTATSTGVYTMQVVGSGGYATQTFTIGSPVTFSGVRLNEDGVTIFKVLNPSGVVMELNSKDCFQVSVKTSLNLTSESIEMGCLCATIFTTDSSGAATVTATINKTVFLWTYQNNQQGVLLNQGAGQDYTFNSATGAFQLSDASAKQYLVMYQ